jgi:hypothetical protein
VLSPHPVWFLENQNKDKLLFEFNSSRKKRDNNRFPLKGKMLQFVTIKTLKQSY